MANGRPWEFTTPRCFAMLTFDTTMNPSVDAGYKAKAQQWSDEVSCINQKVFFCFGFVATEFKKKMYASGRGLKVSQLPQKVAAECEWTRPPQCVKEK